MIPAPTSVKSSPRSRKSNEKLKTTCRRSAKKKAAVKLSRVRSSCFRSFRQIRSAWERTPTIPSLASARPRRDRRFVRRGKLGWVDPFPRSVKDDPAPGQDGGAMAERQATLEIVRGEDQTLAALGEFLELTRNDGAGLGIQAREGFVQKEQVGVVDEGPRNGETLLHPPGVVPNEVVFPAGQEDDLVRDYSDRKSTRLNS